MGACTCLCACVCERGREGERERKKGGERKKGSHGFWNEINPAFRFQTSVAVGRDSNSLLHQNRENSEGAPWPHASFCEQGAKISRNGTCSALASLIHGLPSTSAGNLLRVSSLESGCLLHYWFLSLESSRPQATPCLPLRCPP